NAGYKSYLGKEQQPGPGSGSGEGENSFGGNNWRNFIDCVKSRKRENLNAEIELGATSVILVHLANISYRLGRTINFDPQTLTCKGDAEANALFTRDYRKPFVVPEKV